MLGWGEYDADAKQEAWLALLESGGDVDDPQAWVGVVARTKAVDLARGDQARERAEREHAYTVLGMPVAPPVPHTRDRPWNRGRSTVQRREESRRRRATAEGRTKLSKWKRTKGWRDQPDTEAYRARKVQNVRDWRARQRAL